MTHGRFENEAWLIDWEADIRKGTIINKRTEKSQIFSDNIIPTGLPQYIFRTAKSFIKKTQGSK